MIKTKDAVDALLQKREKTATVTYSEDDLLSTGSTLLNLACTGNPNGGFFKGHYFQIVGDSTSGKTFLSLTCLAEANINKHFEDYRFIFDDGEDGALMDLTKFFGAGVADKIEPPRMEDGESIYSSTLEDFYFHVDDAVKEGVPFIYILDSMDALSSVAEGAKFEERKEASRKGKVTTGIMTDGKAKINSSGLRNVLKGLKDTGSILIIINQTRDKLGFMAGGKTRSGGYALKFYTTLEIWSKVKESITKVVKGKKRDLGVVCELTVKKNRVTGRTPSIKVPILYSHGIDDIGACVDYLIEEGTWKKSGTKVVASGLLKEGTMQRETLIHKIEEDGLEKKLVALVTKTWKDIEKASCLKRKSKYD